MAILFQWKGDGLAAGVTVTTSTAGTGDTAPSIVTGTAPVTSATGPRPPRLKFDQAASVASYLGWSHTSGGTLAYRWYARYSAVPSASMTIAQGLSGGSQRWRLDLAGTGGAPPGELRLRNSAGTQIADSGALGVPLDQEVRIEATLNADVLQVWVFSGDNLTELFSISGTVHAGATCDLLRLGNILTTPTAPTFYADDVRMDNVAVRIGPANPPAFPTWKLWDGAVEQNLTVQGVYDGISVNPLTFGQLT